MATLTPEQVKDYYRTQSGVANPLSPLQYLESVTKTQNAPDVSEMGMASSKAGADVVKKKEATLNKLSSPPPTATTKVTETTPAPKEEKTNQNRALDGTIGTPISFEDAMATFGNDFSGLHQTADGSYIADNTALARAGIKGLGNDLSDPVLKKQREAEEARAEVQNLMGQLEQFTISDAELAGITASISAKWDARIKDMERINKSRIGAITTTGVRTGSRYTGGSGGVFGGIVTEEERQGVTRIAELEAEKQSAIAAAKAAAQEQNWTVFSKKVDIAEKAYQNKIKELEELQKVQAEQDAEIKERERLLIVDAGVSDALSSGLTTVNDIFRNLVSGGVTTTADEVAKSIKNLKEAEKTYPGIIGEWIGAKEVGAIPKEATLDDYLNLKDPGRLLDLQQKRLQISKLEKELASGGIDGDPYELLAYAQQYATTGQIPTGMPKGSFGVISNTAKQIPKATGTIVNKITGVADSKVPATEQQDYARLYNIINNTKRLRELDSKRMGGSIGGTLGAIFGEKDQAAYLATRKFITDDMQRMQSGAALTPDEIAFYTDYLPGRFSDTAGASNILFQDSATKIENFETLVNNRLRERLDVNGLSLYGYSKVKIGGKEYTVGDVITNANGQTGRVLPDGSISLIE